MRTEINFAEKYEKYKNCTTAKGRLRFAVLFGMPESPYFNQTKYVELTEKLASTEPLGCYYLFMQELIRKDYVKAFEYFKLWEPYLFGHGKKYPSNRELQEWYCLQIVVIMKHSNGRYFT